MNSITWHGSALYKQFGEVLSYILLSTPLVEAVKFIRCFVTTVCVFIQVYNGQITHDSTIGSPDCSTNHREL